MKNIDRVKQMGIEKLATILNGDSCEYCVYTYPDCHGDCVSSIKKWLEKEVPTKKRYETIKSDEDLENMHTEFRKYCDKTESCSKCKYNKDYISECFKAFLMEEN